MYVILTAETFKNGEYTRGVALSGVTGLQRPYIIRGVKQQYDIVLLSASTDWAVDAVTDETILSNAKRVLKGEQPVNAKRVLKGEKPV